MENAQKQVEFLQKLSNLKEKQIIELRSEVDILTKKVKRLEQEIFEDENFQELMRYKEKLMEIESICRM